MFALFNLKVNLLNLKYLIPSRTVFATTHQTQKIVLFHIKLFKILVIDLTGALAGFFALSTRTAFEHDVRTKSLSNASCDVTKKSSGAKCYVTERSLVQSKDAVMASCWITSFRVEPETNQLRRARSRSSIPIFASLRSRANLPQFCPPTRTGQCTAEAKYWQFRWWKKH